MESESTLTKGKFNFAGEAYQLIAEIFVTMKAKTKKCILALGHVKNTI